MRNNKIIFLGNINNDSGPSIVNKNLFKNLNHKVLFFECKSKFGKIKLLMRNVFFSDVIVCSGIGPLNVIGAILGFISNSKIIYIMHGAVKLEGEYRSYSFNFYLMEKILISLSCKIICVSQLYKEKLLSSDCYRLSNKNIISIPNGYDKFEYSNLDKENSKIRHIISVGGGRKEKNIIGICESINKIESNILILTVVGADGDDTDKIKSYPFVNYLGEVSQSDLFELYKKNDLYIQYSYLESFGLACVEAVSFGCDLLVSDQVGISSYIDKKFVIPLDNHSLLNSLIFERNNSSVRFEFEKKLGSWEDCSNKHYQEWGCNC